MEPNFIGAPPATAEIEQMPAAPQRGSHHRRAHSDNSFGVDNSFDDLLLFDPSEFDLSDLPLPPPAGGIDASFAVAVDSVSSEESSRWGSRPGPAEPAIGHLRSMSVDSDRVAGDGEKSGEKSAGEGRVERRHRHSNSVDGSPTMSFEGDSSCVVKKAMAPDRLAELARVDPKRAKRILANRQSAAKSKERKMRYASELEKRVQTLQTEATNLSAQLTMIQRDTTDLAARNKELKMRLEAMQQQAQLRSALNEALKEEVQCLKIRTGQVAALTGNPSFGGLLSQFSSQLALQQFPNPPSQLQVPQQPQLCMPPPPPPSGQPFNGQCVPNFSNFNQLN